MPEIGTSKTELVRHLSQA